MLCYLSINRRTQQPYIGIVEGRYLNHPALESGGRKRIKILSINSREDIPVDVIWQILEEAIQVYT